VLSPRILIRSISRLHFNWVAVEVATSSVTFSACSCTVRSWWHLEPVYNSQLAAFSRSQTCCNTHNSTLPQFHSKQSFTPLWCRRFQNSFSSSSLTHYCCCCYGLTVWGLSKCQWLFCGAYECDFITGIPCTRCKYNGYYNSLRMFESNKRRVFPIWYLESV